MDFEGADEDDKWLYGDNENEGAADNRSEAPPGEDSQSKNDLMEDEVSSEVSQDATKNAPLQPPEIRNDEEDEEEKEKSPQEPGEAGEIIDKPQRENGELDEEEDDEDEDSDEDNVNVIIGDINKSGPTYTNINIAKRGITMPTPGIKPQGKFSIEEFESVGVINGVPAHEYNVDGIEDKPWRMPGADITDYFNYGFNEETWKAYCERQKRIRIHESCTGLPMQTTGQAWSNTQSVPTTQYSNTQAPTFQSKKPGWETTGQIRVIGSGVASRRVDEGGQENNSIQVMPPNPEFSAMPPHPNMMPPIIPPMEIPPPGFNPAPAPYGGPPPPADYFNPEPDYFSSYEPTAADQWRDNWAPGTLVTPGPNVKTIHSHEDSPHDGRIERGRSRERSHESDRDDKDRKRDRSHRRSRSRSHEKKRNKSRSRSPSHKKHKKKSKKSDKDKDKDKDKKKRGDDSD